MTKKENEMLAQIYKSLNAFQSQTVKAINDLREEVRENKREIQKSREIEEAHWQENLRCWNENERRWEENDRLWAENKQKWKEYKKNRIQDKNDLIKILSSYEYSISKSLGDPNTEKIKQSIFTMKMMGEKYVKIYKEVGDKIA